MSLLAPYNVRSLQPLRRLHVNLRSRNCSLRHYVDWVAQNTTAEAKRCESLAVPSKPRFNEIGVQQLSSYVYPQVFPSRPEPASPELVNLAKHHLAAHNLLGKIQNQPEPIAFKLPQLQGRTLDEHFYKLGMDAAHPYLEQANEYAAAYLPTKPRTWVRRSGWTKYYSNGNTEKVETPNESLLAFDTEVMWHDNPYAVMACAASPTAWYAWLSPWLLGESESSCQLIPLGDPGRPRIVVGHNIGYDRARIKEEYDLNQSKNFFLDTMSLHVAVNGMCSRQRPTWMRHKKDRDLREKIASETNMTELAALLEATILNEEEEELWIGRSSINSLRDVAKFHCNITIDKSQRDQFGELDRAGILERLEELMDYCAADVAITHQVYKKVFPSFLQVCPHPISFAAMRHLSTCILPVNETWKEYLSNAEETYQKSQKEVTDRLIALADDALAVKDKPEIYNSDPWLQQMDWSGQEIRMVKGKKKDDPPRPAKSQKLPGKPRWYKDLFPTQKAPINLTVRTRVAPFLLKLAWDGYPLAWSDKYGFTFRVPHADAHKYADQSVIRCMDFEEKDCQLRDDPYHVYFKLPHKNGPQARCTNPLAKGYLQYFESGKLSSEYPYAKKALEMNASCSYWISARDRIMSQMVVFPNPDNHTGFILPQIIPMGTITRRAVENTWLTASNAKQNRVGSELKSMITAPPGYVFVGADVDSQELWIASLVGDAQFQVHGGNALGFMTLEGSKAEGTEFHSKTAKILGISRSNAKIVNYGRLYGAGLKFATTLLKQFNPRLSDQMCSDMARTLYANTKGTRTTRKVISPESFWRGGTESLVFNKLEEFAEQERPRTPVLGAGITEALMRRYINKGGFMTSRINWAIQSSGVDYLHLLIISMSYLSSRYNINARLSISVHDEVRYLVKEEDKFRAATALQVANVWTRAMFSQQMGINDLPQSCAYFSAIDIDNVLRKEVDMDCITPSHLDKIPPGQSLDIHTLLAKGSEAYLDPAITPLNPPHPELYEYQPRTPVMKLLADRLGSPKKNFLYLRAQLAMNETELREVVKEGRKPDDNSNKFKSVPKSKKDSPKFDYRVANDVRMLEVPIEWEGPIGSLEPFWGERNYWGHYPGQQQYHHPKRHDEWLSKQRNLRPSA